MVLILLIKICKLCKIFFVPFVNKPLFWFEVILYGTYRTVCDYLYVHIVGCKMVNTLNSLLGKLAWWWWNDQRHVVLSNMLLFFFFIIIILCMMHFVDGFFSFLFFFFFSLHDNVKIDWLCNFAIRLWSFFSLACLFGLAWSQINHPELTEYQEIVKLHYTLPQFNFLDSTTLINWDYYTRLNVSYCKLFLHQTVSASYPCQTNSLRNTTKWTLVWLAQPFLNTSSGKWSNLLYHWSKHCDER